MATKELAEAYIIANISANIVEYFGAKGIRDRLAVKLLRSLAEDIKDYMEKRTPPRMVLFIVKTLPKLTLLKILKHM